MGKMLDISGQVFGRLTAIKPIGIASKTRRGYLWECQCICGKPKIAYISALRSGEVKSCGCFQDENRKLYSNKIYSPDSAARQLYNRYKRVASKVKREFDIDFDIFKRLTSSTCHYCRLEPLQEISNQGYTQWRLYNGIDRMDNSKGYILGNVVPCCKICNYAKRTMGYTEFRLWVLKTAQHMKNTICGASISLGQPLMEFKRV